jgi:hypothetical protein
MRKVHEWGYVDRCSVHDLNDKKTAKVAGLLWCGGGRGGEVMMTGVQVLWRAGGYRHYNSSPTHPLKYSCRRHMKFCSHARIIPVTHSSGVAVGSVAFVFD